MSPTLLLRRLGAALLDLLYPRRCGGCNRVGTWMCDRCLAAIGPPAVPGWCCATCGAALEPAPTGLACPAGCRSGDLTAVLCAGAYAGPLREAIHRFKYERWRVLAPALARFLDATCAAEWTPWPADVTPYLVPVPLHPRRQRDRGFNQAALLARAAGGALQWPVLAGLERVRATPHQVGLTAAERALNLEEAFAWRGKTPPPGGPLVLVDDVYTSGATMRACAEALCAAGGGPVYGLALARPSQAAGKDP